MATTKQQNKVLNIAMIALAVVIVVAGIAAFMLIRGGQGQPSSYVVSDKTGYANIERAGINYALDVGTALQDSDSIETLDGSEVGVKGPGDSTLFLADASKMQVRANDSASSQMLDLVSGCMFIDAQSPDSSLALAGSERTWTANDAVYVSDVRKGTLTVQVLLGSVTFDDGTVVKQGESRTCYVNQGQDSAQGQSSASASAASGAQGSKAADSTSKLTLSAMDAFALEHALDAIGSGRELVFSEDQITGEQERREAEKRKLAEQAAAASKAAEASKSAESADASAESASAEQDQGSADEAANLGAGENAEQAEAVPEDQVVEAQEEYPEETYIVEETVEVPAEEEAEVYEEYQEYPEDEGTYQEETIVEETPAEAPAEVDETRYCTIQITCSTILDNKDSLAEGKSKYVPKNGVILSSTSVEFAEGESAFDVLKRVCGNYGIALEYSYAPVYGSYYVEGIGNLYEFDCGDESGWMYKVNGWFPNYGCSEYTLSDGDAIEFCYTCNGLGEDVGA